MEIVHIKEVKREANPEIVKALENLLERAKQGEIRQLCSIANVDGVWLHLMHGVTTVGDTLAMTGMIEAAKARVISYILWHNKK